MFVVLATNTNQDNTVFGPFKSEDKAWEFRHAASEADHLHAYHVMEVQKPEEEA